MRSIIQSYDSYHYSFSCVLKSDMVQKDREYEDCMFAQATVAGSDGGMVLQERQEIKENH